MKLLIIFLFILSCNEVRYAKFETSKVEALQADGRFSDFNPEIKVMLMFLWPKKMSSEDEKIVTTIISDSINIFKKRTIFLKKSKNLKDKFLNESCDCHLYYECGDDELEDEEKIPLCEETEEALSNVESQNAFFYEQYNIVKNRVESIGGRYFDVGMDDDFVDIGYVNFKDKQILLKSADLQSSEREEVSIEIANISSKEMALKFRANDMNLSSTLDIIERSHSLVFQGELNSDKGHMGVIYWEHSK